jgi:hypothetical protein
MADKHVDRIVIEAEYYGSGWDVAFRLGDGNVSQPQGGYTKDDELARVVGPYLADLLFENRDRQTRGQR